MSRLVEGLNVLISGGTGSLGTALVKRLLAGYNPHQIIIFSRDELKQANMKSAFNDGRLEFVLGDVRDYPAVASALSQAHIVINAAALKRVEVCEKHPDEAIATNYMGAANIVRAIRELRLQVQTLISIGSDKGARPLNVYGMTKALQEARFLVANVECPWCRFIGVRYGNVMGSRGSVVPIWLEQIRNDKAITVTDPDMTRFLISLDQAVDTILTALELAMPGEVYIPKIPAAKIGDMANAIGNGNGYLTIGKGKGEKMHEILITEEEAERTLDSGDYYVITKSNQKGPALKGEYISYDHLISRSEVQDLFIKYGFIKEKVTV